MLRIANIVGARPNFMKIAPLIREMRKYADVAPSLIHTGQHYDVSMAGQFFHDLQMPPPDVSLHVGSGSHAHQTAEVMKGIEPVLETMRPQLVLVVGDVNSTLAAALTAAKLHIPVAHVEAGLRSFDRTMPEEINRLVTDAVSEYLFVTEESGRQNLLREGIDADKIHLTGNVMIDSLEASRRLWEQSDIRRRLRLQGQAYGVVTLHRAANVDEPTVLHGLVDALERIARELPVFFPLHPRTRKQLAVIDRPVAPFCTNSEVTVRKGLCGLEPLGYVDFMALLSGARLVLTDSGGLQEETTALGIPCLTLRENTERPITVTHGVNRIVGTAPERIIGEALRILAAPIPSGVSAPPLWDGKASERIVSVLRERVR